MIEGSDARLAERLVFLVGDLFAPVGGRLIAGVLGEGEVDHESVWGGAVPVLLVGLKEDAIAGADLFDRPAAALTAADAFGDEDRLAERVGVPGGSGPLG